MKTFLFQGDSITDVGRVREWAAHLGAGYPAMAAGKIAFNHPGQFRFVNKGISGERSTGLYARCMFEMRECNPDYMSVLIGVNDVWHALGNGDTVRPNRYEQLLTMLVEDALEAFPNITIAILEPFVLKGPATEGQWEAFDSNVRTVAKIAKQVAERYHLVFVPLQEKFDALAEATTATDWLNDGVHPTSGGHEMIAGELVKALGL